MIYRGARHEVCGDLSHDQSSDYSIQNQPKFIKICTDERFNLQGSESYKS